MAATFHLRIATPEREVYNTAVESVKLPGLQSSFGVLRNHAPLVAALEPGIVEIVDIATQRKRLAVGGGFFQVAHNEAILLADSADFADEIDVEEARQDERRAFSRLEGKLDAEHGVAREQAEAELKRARVRLKLAGG